MAGAPCLQPAPSSKSLTAICNIHIYIHSVERLHVRVSLATFPKEIPVSLLSEAF